MTTSHTHPLFAALMLCALTLLPGCFEPPSHEAIDGRSPACVDAIEHGVAGDSCDFDETFATSLACASHLPPPPDGPGHVVDIAAHCSEGTLVLQRQRYLLDAPPIIGVGRVAGECLTYGTALSRPIVVCTADDLLPSPTDLPAVDLDAAGACAALLDESAAGDPCVGGTVCGMVETRHIFEPDRDPTGLYGRPARLTWCGNGRLRTAFTLVKLTCNEHYIETHDAYVCPLGGTTPS